MSGTEQKPSRVDDLVTRAGLTRRDFLKGSVLVVGAGVGAIAYGLGTNLGGSQEREKHLPPGEGRLAPELRDKLEAEGYFIYESQGETVETLRASGKLELNSYPLIEGDADWENTPSNRAWLAVDPDNFYLPGEEDVTSRQTPSQLDSLIKGQTGSVQTELGNEKGVQVSRVEVIDLLGLNNAYESVKGESLIKGGGFFLTSTTAVDKEGNRQRIAVGRYSPDSPFSYRFYPDRLPQDYVLADTFRAARVIIEAPQRR